MSGYDKIPIVKILLPKTLNLCNICEEELYHLSEGFGIHFEDIKPVYTKKWIFKKLKFYRAKFETWQSQKYVVGILKMRGWFD